MDQTSRSKRPAKDSIVTLARAIIAAWKADDGGDLDAIETMLEDPRALGIINQALKRIDPEEAGAFYGYLIEQASTLYLEHASDQGTAMSAAVFGVPIMGPGSSCKTFMKEAGPDHLVGILRNCDMISATGVVVVCPFLLSLETVLNLDPVSVRKIVRMCIEHGASGPNEEAWRTVIPLDAVDDNQIVVRSILMCHVTQSSDRQSGLDALRIGGDIFDSFDDLDEADVEAEIERLTRMEADRIRRFTDRANEAMERWDVGLYPRATIPEMTGDMIQSRILLSLKLESEKCGIPIDVMTTAHVLHDNEKTFIALTNANDSIGPVDIPTAGLLCGGGDALAVLEDMADEIVCYKNPSLFIKNVRRGPVI